MSATATSLDASLFFLINHGTGNPLFDVLMPLLSDRGYLLVFPPLLLAVARALPRPGGRPAGSLRLAVLLLILPVAMFFASDMLNDLLKDIFARHRPCQALEGVRLLVRCPRSFSMPSGHAIASFSFSVTFFVISREVLSAAWRWYALVLAAMIAFSRVYIGVHYPSDILIGAALGSVLSAAVSLFLLRIFPRTPDDRQKHEAP